VDPANEADQPGPVRLPLFPLGTVLFPGLVLPLHVFEQRYRTLVQDLRALPDGVSREFGVVAIRRGWEVGRPDRPMPDSVADQVPAGSLIVGDALSLYEIGCTAEVRQITELEDGRFDLVTVGRRRFRLRRIEPADTPYLTGEIEWLPDEPTDPERADDVASGVVALFQRYLRLVRRGGGADHEPAGEQLPDDPTVLSHLVAATTSLTLDERQRLLAEPDTITRLKAERKVLRREVALLRQVRAVPASLAEFATATSPN
jgi:uncharacterized protein